MQNEFSYLQNQMNQQQMGLGALQCSGLGQFHGGQIGDGFAGISGLGLAGLSGLQGIGSLWQSTDISAIHAQAAQYPNRSTPVWAMPTSPPTRYRASKYCDAPDSNGKRFGSQPRG